VVILLDGYREAQPGFKMDPYAPTVQNPQSYCPESWNSSASTEGEADFWGTPTGPWSFFHKWNFGEVNSSGGATGNDESAPRAVPGNPQGITPGTYTHSFMLDAIAAQGAVILPFSYKGAMLQPGSPDPTFVFPPYTTCDSQPGSCGTSIPSDAALLAAEVKSIVIAWPNTPIVVVGHSQGGLIAFSWWRTYSIPRSFDQGFSLDSPINGINPCIPGVCVTLPSYPKYQDRQKNDPGWLAADTGPDTAFHFIGTYGDPLGIGPIKFYGTGAETLEHQMLFDYNTYSASQIESACAKPLDESGCPAPSPPDHISECPILFFPDWEQDAGHFVEKFCPGDVTFVDNVLGLPY
jgi:hypothetical protein